MALNLEDKKAIVAEVSTVASESISLVVADYRGIAVPKMTDLRKRARASGIYLRVIRNTLARRAIKGTGFECIDDKLTGPLVFGFAKNEPGAAAKLFRDFAKENEAFKVQGLTVAGEYYPPSHLEAVASLPTKHEALCQLAAMLMAPATQLARTIKEPAQMLVRALDDLSKKQQ